MARPTTPDPTPARSPLDRVLPALAIALALALRLWLMAANSGLTMDSALYVRMSEWLRAGHHEASPAHHGYPVLIAAASLLLPGRELPARVVSLLASLVLVVLCWRLARRHSPPWRAFVPALAVAVHPLLAVYGVAIMTEATFLALALGAVTLLDAGRLRAGGALFGAAWWVRPEAAVLAPVAIVCARGTRRERALALLFAVLAALSYNVFLRVEQGQWSLTPKTALVRAPFQSARAAEWQLSDDAVAPESASIPERATRTLMAVAGNYPAQLAVQLRHVAQAWDPLLLAGTVLGLLTGAARGPWLAFLVLPFVYPLLAAPPDLRFAQLVLPALVLPLAFVRLPRGRALQGLALAALGAGLAWLWAGPSARLARSFDDGPMAALRGAGTWLGAHSPENAVVMDRKSYVAFFAARRHVQLPDEPLDGILDYARMSGATHLVVEEYVVRALRPQLAPLLDERTIAAERRVRLVFALRPAPGDGVAVFEIVR